MPWPAEVDRLTCPVCGGVVPIVQRVPRFVPTESYAASFGTEWTRFPDVQLDSVHGTSFSQLRFRQLCGIDPYQLDGKRVLDAGCGPGRFLDVLAPSGAEIWGADMSRAVEAAARNLARWPNCRVIQADLFDLPFAADFDLIYCFGVLQHTPYPEKAVAALARHLRPGGYIAIWAYGRSGIGGYAFPWLPRPHQFLRAVLKTVPASMQDRALRAYTRCALAAGAVPVAGPGLRKLLPVQDLRRRAPGQDGYDPGADPALIEQLRFEWALHSAYDGLTPAYVRKCTDEDLARWAEEAGLTEIRPGGCPASVLARRPPDRPASPND